VSLSSWNVVARGSEVLGVKVLRVKFIVVLVANEMIARGRVLKVSNESEDEDRHDQISQVDLQMARLPRTIALCSSV
jgi:hypothetical protein